MKLNESLVIDMKKAIIYTLVFLALQFVVQIILSVAYVAIWQDTSGTLPVWADIVIMVVYSVATIVLFLSLGWTRVSRTYVRSKPWGVLPWSVVAALGIIVPSLLLQSLLPEWTGWAKEMADQTDLLFSQLMRNPGGYLVVALLPPVVEELVFRGAVLRSLLEWKPQRPWLMIVVSALIFALVHVNPAQLLHTFLVGLLLGWLYWRTGSVVPGVALHWTNNTAAYVLFHLYHNPQSLQDIVGPGTQPVLLALGFSLCILLPALYQLNLLMGKRHS